MLLGTACPTLNSFGWNQLQLHKGHSETMQELELPFIEQEVVASITEMPTNKAPRPNGFTGCLYKKSWLTIKEDVLAVFTELHSMNRTHFDKINKTNVVLLLKKGKATDIAEFRSISLIHSLAKLLTKVLSNHLATHMECLICTP